MVRRFLPVIFCAFILACASAFLLVPHDRPTPEVAGLTYYHSGQNKIRLIALKHSKESMADGDANLAISAVSKAAAKGLPIQTVGNHYINKEGKMQVVALEFNNDLPKLKAFVSEQMKLKAEAGDTVVLFTIGHGHPDGSLAGLGQRSGVMKAIADAAEENSQKTLWWQLSCHASANLPAISTLTPAQQELLGIYASSTPSELSAAGVQGKIMEKVFIAMAERSKEIDPDQDENITTAELRDFLNKVVGNRRGDLLYTKSPTHPVFGGGGGLANQIPIFDRNGPQGKYPPDYIPVPSKP